MKKLIVGALAAGALLAPAGAASAEGVSVDQVRAEAQKLGRSLDADRRSGVSDHWVEGCTRTSRRRVRCTLVLVARSTEGGHMRCAIRVRGVQRGGRLRIRLGRTCA